MAGYLKEDGFVKGAEYWAEDWGQGGVVPGELENRGAGEYVQREERWCQSKEAERVVKELSGAAAGPMTFCCFHFSLLHRGCASVAIGASYG